MVVVVCVIPSLSFKHSVSAWWASRRNNPVVEFSPPETRAEAIAATLSFVQIGIKRPLM
jgi:hypothetical protein